MRIINTYPEIVTLYGELGGTFDMTAWEAYAARISPSLVAMCKEDLADYDFDTEALPTLTNALNKRADLDKTHESFAAVTAGLPERFREIFGVDMDVDIVLYFGLCNGAGWATPLDGRFAVLLGVEQIIKLGWHSEKSMIGLIYHELGHILHLFHGHRRALHMANERLTGGDKWLWQLYYEGIAMYCEQLLVGDFACYHQDVDGWADWCRAN